VIRDHFDHIFVLKMARSIKRRAMFFFQSSTFGLSNDEIIQAVDGRTLDLEMMRSQGILQWDTHLKRDLTAGEVGCYLSHISAWKTLLERKLKTALICEDDVVWRIDANAIVDRFMAEVPCDWDILHFHNSVRIGSGQYNDHGRKKISEYVWQGFNEGRGAACYAITARGASFLFNIAFPICSTVDGRINWLTGWWKKCEGYRGYICWPFPCEVGNVQSEIDAVSQRPGEMI
jgi:glycosyl transferase family 25